MTLLRHGAGADAAPSARAKAGGVAPGVAALRAGVILAAAAVGVTWALGNVPFVSVLELKGLDLLFLGRGRVDPPGQIVIVAIDSPSFAELGEQWPWPRTYHARVIDRLKQAGARVIGVDVLLSEPSKSSTEDDVLARAIEEAGNVVLVRQLEVTDRPSHRLTQDILPLEKFRAGAAGTGITNLPIGVDGGVRSALLQFPVFSSLGFPSFAFEVARVYGAPPSAREIVINHFGPAGTVRTVSYYQVLQDDATPGGRTLPAETFAGKIVLIGLSVQATPEPRRLAPDTFPTPFLAGAGTPTSGVELQATIIGNVIAGRAIAELAPAARVGLLMVLAVVSSLVLLGLGPLGRVGATFALGALYLGGAYALFANGDHWLPVVAGPLVLILVCGGWLVDGMLRDRKAAERLTRLYEQYLEPRVRDDILQLDATGTTGERRVVTVLFCDLAHFSAISERLTPTGLVRFMNHFFSWMSEPVRPNHGVVDKYVGDAVMAWWGRPFTRDDEHGELACLTALQQLANLDDVRRTLPEVTDLRAEIPEVSIRIGLATGWVVVGAIGSEWRKNYTVMGDSVNLASRLEGANKHYGTRVLMSEETWVLARDAFETREIDSVRVVGKTEPVRIFELLCRRGALAKTASDLRDRYEQGLSAYRKGDWHQAQAYFEACLGVAPDDAPSKVLIARLKQLQERPPAPEWDGVWSLTEK